MVGPSFPSILNNTRPVQLTDSCGTSKHQYSAADDEQHDDVAQSLEPGGPSHCRLLPGVAGRHSCPSRRRRGLPVAPSWRRAADDLAIVARLMTTTAGDLAAMHSRRR